MQSSVIDEIKSRLDIVEVIKEYIKVEKAGVNYRAKCPFHAEKSPSFFISPAKQIWHCFGGCNSGGDIFKFVMQIEGVEFPEALRILAKKAGVEIKRENPEVVDERQRLFIICEIATLFFEAQMKSVVGGEAKEYLKGRGINEESIKKWRIGYSPDSWSSLSEFLIGKGFQRKEIIKVGLALEKDGKVFDRFRARIIFPIFDARGQVIGYGGRIFKKEDPAKYLNSPATVLYDKSKVLYGLNVAKIPIRKKDSCVLVEGYTDVILSHQAGVENAISTSGTALTLGQLELLKRHTNNLITSFDMDLAGNSATTRGISLAQASGFNIRTVSMPSGKDPADVAKENSEEWVKLVEKNKSITEFYFDVVFNNSGYDKRSPEGKKAISDILLPIIKRLNNRIEQAHWVQELSSKLGVKEEHIEEELKKVKPEKETQQQNKSERIEEAIPAKQTRIEMLEERLVSLLLKSPERANLIEESLIEVLDERLKPVVLSLKRNEKIEENDFINYLYLRADVEGIEEKDILEEINFCIKAIKTLVFKRLLDQRMGEMRIAEYNKDDEQTKEIEAQIEKLIREINQLTKNGQ